MATGEFEETVAEEIYEELEADEELEDFDREDLDPSVTYVQHTKPEVPSADNDLDFDGQTDNASGKDSTPQSGASPASQD